MGGIEAAQEEGEVDGQSVIPEKLHIRGLNTLTTADIRAYVKEHCSSAEDLFKRVEWIDDESANLIFDNSEAATDALLALSEEVVADELALRPAKPISTHPGVQLQIRQAIAADVKLPGAKDRSRFYLFNPQYDPDVRAQNRKRRYEEDRGGSQNKRRNNGRRDSDETPSFNVDFYDDSTALPDAEVQSKRSQMEDLFKNRKTKVEPRATRAKDGRLRDRSASPDRDGNGKYGFEEVQPYRRTARQRSATPPHLRKARRRDQDPEDGKYMTLRDIRLTTGS